MATLSVDGSLYYGEPPGDQPVIVDGIRFHSRGQEVPIKEVDPVFLSEVIRDIVQARG